VSETFLIWGLALLGVALVLVALEIFIPSAGVLGVLATIAAIAGIVLLFKHDTSWGLIGLIAVMVLGPVVFGFALRMWPHTPIGRYMIQGRVTEADREQAREQRMREVEARQALVGQEGKALTDLRPVGTVRVGDQRLDALAEVGFIESGRRVRVISVGDNQIKVRSIG